VAARRLLEMLPALLAAASALSVLGCGGPGLEPHATGSLQVGTLTTGPGTDADGYTVMLDDVAQTTIGINDQVQLNNIEAGTHTVRLDDLEPNCAASFTSNPQSVVVKASETSGVSFSLYCTHPGASVEVTTITTGPSPDPDGYMVVVDNGTPLPIGINATVLVENLTPSSHLVGLSGVAANCQVDGENPQHTAVLGYGQKASVTFTITCS
jgi:hypothetical protein